MPRNRRLQRKVRARMKRTGEPYTEALRAVRALQDAYEAPNASTPRQIAAGSDDPPRQ